MKLQRILLLKLAVVSLTLVIFHPGFSQVAREESISFSGPIDNIPKDSNFIVVNERRVFISSNTKIASVKGIILKKGDLKRGLAVTIEGVRKPEGIFAENITVLLTPKIKP
jgi:hypothetical protein